MPDPKLKLSRRAVERLEPAAKRYIVWDADVAGFGVRVGPSGSRTYLLQYRVLGHGRSQPARTLTLGRHGQITVDQAREIAHDALGRIRAGGDPARERSLIKQRETVARLIEINLAWLRRQRKATSVTDAEHVLQRYVLPAIGRLAVADVQRRDIRAIADRLEAEGKRRTAGKVIQVCRAMFARSELDEAPWNRMRTPGSNPAARLTVHLGERRKRQLSTVELQALGRALRAASSRGENPWLLALILLLLLTGARLRELLLARWAWVDWQEHCLRLPESKTGAKVIYFSPVAMAVLERVPHLDGNPYIIAGTREKQPLVNPYKGWARIMALAGISGLTPHDLRRTYASMGLAGGLSLEQIGALLGHSRAETTKGYAYLQADPARQSTALIGESIRQLLDEPHQAELWEGRTKRDG